MDPQQRSWLAGLLVILGLVALALLTGTGYTQGEAPANLTDQPAASTVDAAAASAANDQIDCEDPPTGQRVKLVASDLIGLAWYKDKGSELRATWFQDQDKTLFKRSDGDWRSPDAVAEISWPSTVWADLDGDYKDEQVVAFRDRNQRVAAAIVPTGGALTPWYCDKASCQGKEVRWVNIAAGNLDGHTTGDHDDEVVIAFSDSTNGLHLFVLDRADLGTPNQATASYEGDLTHGRGKVANVALATGDLDGDGYDNEIVVTFVDATWHLQAIIFRWDAVARS